MELTMLREEMDKIDRELLELFRRRMELSARIGESKRQVGKAVYDPQREREKLRSAASQLPEELKNYAYPLYSLLMQLSRSYQNRLQGVGAASAAALKSLQTGVLPGDPLVACQGTEGAYSQLACEQAFPHPGILYLQDFEGVFQAVEKGLCRYGLLPLENSTAGSVDRVYDLMMQHRFYIVRSIRIKVDHALLACPGVELKDIRQIWSHPQALGQCAGFLHSLSGVQTVPRSNTAAAARELAAEGRTDTAVLASRSCASLYGLQCIREAVQDIGGNQTRFICFGKDPELEPGADRSSLMMILPNKPGSLYRVLSSINALGINLLKLESRPIPQRDSEFMFYFDLEISALDPAFSQLLEELPDLCERFTYLGCYREVR